MFFFQSNSLRQLTWERVIQAYYQECDQIGNYSQYYSQSKSIGITHRFHINGANVDYRKKYAITILLLPWDNMIIYLYL